MRISKFGSLTEVEGQLHGEGFTIQEPFEHLPEAECLLLAIRGRIDIELANMRGYVVCEHCHGRGWFEQHYDQRSKETSFRRSSCGACKGAGKFPYPHDPNVETHVTAPRD